MRDMKIFLTLIWLSTLAGHAEAVDVYKCKGKDGEVSFSNMPCRESVGNAPHSSYDSAPARIQIEERGYAESDETSRTVRGSSGRSEIPSSLNETGRVNGTSPAAAFECESQGQRWLQAEPCPAHTSSTRNVPFNGFDAVTGAPIHGTVEQEVNHDVESRSVTASELCDKLRKEQNRSTPANDRGASTYERNKMRDKNGC